MDSSERSYCLCPSKIAKDLECLVTEGAASRIIDPWKGELCLGSKSIQFNGISHCDTLVPVTQPHRALKSARLVIIGATFPLVASFISYMIKDKKSFNPSRRSNHVDITGH